TGWRQHTFSQHICASDPTGATASCKNSTRICTGKRLLTRITSQQYQIASLARRLLAAIHASAPSPTSPAAGSASPLFFVRRQGMVASADKRRGLTPDANRQGCRE